MKTIHFILVTIVAVAIFGCKSGQFHPTYITGINPDGSCYKLIETDADSAFMVGDTAKSNPLGVDLDSLWKISWRLDTSEFKTNWPLKSWMPDTQPDTLRNKITLTVRAIRHYNSVEEMAKEFRFSKKHAWNPITPEYKFEKKFRWFYTYFTYSEVYPKLETFDKIPFERYLTPQEAEFWFNGNFGPIKGMNGIEIKDLTISIEDKFNRWFEHNIWEEEMTVLTDNYHLLGKPPVSKERLISMKDSLFNLFRGQENDKDGTKDLKSFLDKIFKTKEFSGLYEQPGNPVKAYEDSIEKKDFLGFYEKSIDYNLILPGKIISAGNALNDGDTLKFNLDAYRMTYKDYEIKATSRKTNTWAFWITGLIVLLALGSLFVKKR